MPLNDLASAFVNLLQAQNLADLPFIAQAIRLIVTKDYSSPMDELINTGVVPYIISVLRPQFFSEAVLISECSWIITNIVSIDKYIKDIVQLEIIPIAMGLLDHPVSDIKENAIWILSNVASESYDYRVEILNGDISIKIDQLFADTNRESKIYYCLIWLISNLCMGKPYPDFSLVYFNPYFFSLILYRFVDFWSICKIASIHARKRKW